MILVVRDWNMAISKIQGKKSSKKQTRTKTNNLKYWREPKTYLSLKKNKLSTSPNICVDNPIKKYPSDLIMFPYSSQNHQQERDLKWSLTSLNKSKKEHTIIRRQLQIDIYITFKTGTLSKHRNTLFSTSSAIFSTNAALFVW